ncbi:MAG TPA: response regulator [Mobilitalea sp.]|nr:response regulator [Mobilitalea sp.]
MNRSILIADDEELIREGIKARLEYLELKPDELYEAENALQAIELLKEHTVDIVITDIRMPDMDGITFIKQVKPLYPNIQFIILSGYAEFEYAEQAIQLGVKAYLLKPISNDSLKKAIEDVIAKLEENEKIRRTVREGARSILENKSYLFEKTMNDLLRSTETVMEVGDAREIVCKEFPMEHRWLMMAIINIDTESYEFKLFEYKDIDLIKFVIKNIYDELPSQCIKVIVNNLTNMNQLYAFISHVNKNQLRIEAEKLFTNLQNIMWKKMKISVTFGISSVTNLISDACNKEAQEAFLQRLIHGKSNLFFYDDIKILSANQFPSSEIHMLRQYIERHDAGNIEFFIHDIFSDDNIKKYNASYIRIVWARIINILLNVASPSFTNNPKNMEKLVLNFEILDSFRSMDELRNYLYMLILDCIQVDADIDINAKNKIKLGIKYIQDNYNRDIAINELAEKFAISPNYFSTVFKRETGQTTVNYIKDLRLKKACEYLVNSNKSIVDISKEVGYEDSQYFFRVFKKATGLTPLEYRRTHRKN